MKIYFSAALIYKDKRGKSYDRIMDSINKSGHKLLNYGMEREVLDIKQQDSNQFRNHYKSVLKWMNQSDLVVVEASFPSTMHIGHEISLALDKGKPVVVLYEKGFSPFFLEGADKDKLILSEYNSENLEEVLSDAIEYAASQQDVRLNFFISPAIGNYLDWISKEKKIPRSVYLRGLIEKDMEDSEEYNS